MNKRSYREHVGNLPDDELYCLAKKYLIQSGNGILHNSWRGEIIYDECQRRQTDIFQRAAEDAIDIIDKIDDAMQGLRITSARYFHSLTDDEARQFINEISTDASNSIAELKGAERQDIFKILGIQEKNLLLCRVNGSSMINADIIEGDIIIVDTAAGASHGEIVVASVGGEMFVKKLMFKGSSLYLVSENQLLEPFEITNDLKFSVVGVVKYIFHKVQLEIYNES